jgi:hypothetical protein
MSIHNLQGDYTILLPQGFDECNPFFEETLFL